MNLFILIFGICLTLLCLWNTFQRHTTYRVAWGGSAFLLLSGLTCLLIGEMGATMDDRGIVHEVGLLLPFGAFLFLLGIVGVVILTVLYLVRFTRSYLL